MYTDHEFRNFENKVLLQGWNIQVACISIEYSYSSRSVHFVPNSDENVNCRESFTLFINSHSLYKHNIRSSSWIPSSKREDNQEVKKELATPGGWITLTHLQSPSTLIASGILLLTVGVPGKRITQAWKPLILAAPPFRLDLWISKISVDNLHESYLNFWFGACVGSKKWSFFMRLRLVRTHPFNWGLYFLW